MLVFNAVQPVGSKVTGIQCWFSALRLRAEISPDSLNLLMVLQTVDDEIPKFPKFLAIIHWETLFLKCNTICSRSCSQSGELRPILGCEQLSHSGMLLLYLILALTCFQLTCSPVECSKQVFFKHSSTFLCCPCPSNSKWVNVCKSSYSVSIYVLHNVPTSLELGFVCQKNMEILIQKSGVSAGLLTCDKDNRRGALGFQKTIWQWYGLGKHYCLALNKYYSHH